MKKEQNIRQLAVILWPRGLFEKTFFSDIDDSLPWKKPETSYSMYQCENNLCFLLLVSYVECNWHLSGCQWGGNGCREWISAVLFLVEQVREEGRLTTANVGGLDQCWSLNWGQIFRLNTETTGWLWNAVEWNLILAQCFEICYTFRDNKRTVFAEIVLYLNNPFGI